MKIVIFGPPGAGKGTQAEAIMKRLSIPAISTGDILRDAINRKTPVGLRVKKHMDSGDLVPDEVIIGIVIDRISKKDCEGGYILDGVPRTIGQAGALDKKGIMPDVVLSLEVPDDEIITRLGGRRACPNCRATFHIVSKPPAIENVCDICGTGLITRKDDDPETISHRLVEYHKETEPLIEYYRSQGIFKPVANAPGISETTEEVFKVLAI